MVHNVRSHRTRPLARRCWEEEVAAKIADVLEVSLDYLAGNSNKAAVDKKTMKLIHDIEDLVQPILLPVY